VTAGPTLCWKKVDSNRWSRRDGPGSTPHEARAALLASKSASRNRKFESTPLQGTVRVSRDIPVLRRKAGLFPRMCGAEQARGRERRAWRGHLAPTGGNISVGPNSSTAASMTEMAYDAWRLPVLRVDFRPAEPMKGHRPYFERESADFMRPGVRGRRGRRVLRTLTIVVD